jgi:hypothetical protein
MPTPTGLTTAADLIVPEYLAEAITGYIPGMSIMARTGAVRIETGLPDVRGGETVKVPYFGSLGRMKDYADGAPIEVTRLTMSDESAYVTRSGIAFNLTDFARRVAAYANPHDEGARQIVAAIELRANDAAITAAVGPGLPNSMVRTVYNPGVPRYYDLDLFTETRMAFADEQAGLVAQCVHSTTLKRMLQLKTAVGERLLRIVSQDAARGVIEFEGMPPTFVSDALPVDFPVAAAGTAPPAVTLTGMAFGDFAPRLEITTPGPRGVAIFRYSLDGGATWEGADQPTAESVPLGESGLVAGFAVGGYAADNVYTSVPRYTTMLLKRDALVFWFDPPNAEDFRDPLRKSTISATEILHVTHRYKRLPGMLRGGVALARHN